MNSQPTICQSCSMPMRKEEDFGTDADGSKNREYCHFCYQGGKFTDEGITMEEKIEKMVSFAKTMHIPEENARKMTRSILPTLKRWK
jgi:hypothetical protein